uniref:Uncharacterized protein n=1 Tax=Clastoptera arizonana TaxID=38151 RepID=A0A1B6CNU4_9HEMI
MSSYSKHNERRNSLKHNQTNIIKINEEENKNKWMVLSSDSDNEDVNDGKQLTTLVRKSYTKHLKDTLAKNIAEWKKTVESIDSIHNIERWVSILEQKALRSCMLAELYQKTMIHMVRQKFNLNLY